MTSSLIATEKIISVLREALNLHKRSLADYVYLSSNMHKGIREALNPPQGLPVDWKSVEGKISNLEGYLYKAFGQAFSQQMSRLSKMMGDPSRQRSCIKVIDENNLITTLYRYPEESPVDWDTINMSENTGFSQVMKSGDHFLCNDIPQSILNGEYKNSRVNADKLKSYSMQKPDESIDDKDWEDCWEKISENNTDKKCYKSTLIVPMMLETELLSESLVQYLKPANKSKEILLGFLCLDHPSSGFFDEIGVDICKIFSDTMSLFLFQQLNNTLLSTTYDNAVQAIESMQAAEIP
jgi:hypothetical protein